MKKGSYVEKTRQKYCRNDATGATEACFNTEIGSWRHSYNARNLLYFVQL